MLMMRQFSQSKFTERLWSEATSHGLDYLAYAFLPIRGLEGMLVEVGDPRDGSRLVKTMAACHGRAELLWTSTSGSFDAEQAERLLEELEGYRTTEAPPLSQRLHATICQSLTAAHLHLELGLMSNPEAGEVFNLAQGLVHEATTSVRELIDELAGGEP